MEWQANNIAPRILMPLGQFKQKVDELYKQYDYVGTPLKLITMECIAQDLASFYEVSRQSVLIRMMECGYPEANSITPTTPVQEPVHTSQIVNYSWSIGQTKISVT